MKGRFYSRAEIEGIVQKIRSPNLKFGAGKVFFVDGYGGRGSDLNDGDDPARPLSTITHALSLCRHGKDDVIIVFDYWQPTGETWPILVNKQKVHIIGLSNPNAEFIAIHPPGDTACFQLSSDGQYGEIAGFCIGGGNNHGGIEYGNAGQVDGFWIHDCWFGHQWFGTPLNGILNPATATRGGYGNRIEWCTFMGDLANCKGKITGNAIDVLMNTDATATRDLEILDCVFKGGAIAINLTRAFDAVILRNKFVCPDAQVGEAVTLGASSRGCLVDDNVGMNGGDAVMTNNPFRDLATGANNHWGVNYKTNAVILPAQA